MYTCHILVCISFDAKAQECEKFMYFLIFSHLNYARYFVNKTQKIEDINKQFRIGAYQYVGKISIRFLTCTKKNMICKLFDAKAR